jgi:hypothetical protein
MGRRGPRRGRAQCRKPKASVTRSHRVNVQEDISDRKQVLMEGSHGSQTMGPGRNGTTSGHTRLDHARGKTILCGDCVFSTGAPTGCTRRCSEPNVQRHLIRTTGLQI